VITYYPTRAPCRPTILATPPSPPPPPLDNGNGSFATSNGARPPAATNWAGRVSNGPVWNDYLGGRPFSRVVNLAHAGAAACPGASGGRGPPRTGGPPGPPPMPGPPPLSVLNQTARYLAGPGQALRRAGARRVVVLWIGVWARAQGPVPQALPGLGLYIGLSGTGK
jgi:hypothetical protein